jgi:hypothetical protein
VRTLAGFVLGVLTAATGDYIAWSSLAHAAQRRIDAMVLEDEARAVPPGYDPLPWRQ